MLELEGQKQIQDKLRIEELVEQEKDSIAISIQEKLERMIQRGSENQSNNPSLI